MLATLSIRDFALIEKIDLDLQLGLTVITGETGAGKSILLDAFSLLLGRRARRDLIRDGRDKATVEALFFSPEKYLPTELMTELGLSESELILSREIRADGRSLARVNGRLVNLSVLEEISSYLIAIHGQNAQEEIYRADRQLAFLDAYGDQEQQELLAEWAEAVQKRRAIVSRIRELGLNPRERERELEILNYQISELEAADLSPGEDEKIQKQAKKISALQKINADLDLFSSLMSGEGERGLRASLAEALASLEYPARFSKRLSAIYEDLGLMAERFQEIDFELSDIRDQLAADAELAQRVHERLNLINELKRKYGDSLEEISCFLQESIERRDFLLATEAHFHEAESELRAQETLMDALSERLNAKRKETGERLAKDMTMALRELNMPEALFAVSYSPQAERKYSAAGSLAVTFLFNANPGEELKTLAQVASGGEASRLILAIKSLAAEQKDIPVLIFDEIDQGVGGLTAAKVGARLKVLAAQRQVLCVTHSAAIAARADTHILLEKDYDGERSQSHATFLNPDERLLELARLLSGTVAMDESLALASSLLAEAQNEHKKE